MTPSPAHIPLPASPHSPSPLYRTTSRSSSRSSTSRHAHPGHQYSHAYHHPPIPPSPLSRTSSRPPSPPSPPSDLSLLPPPSRPRLERSSTSTTVKFPSRPPQDLLDPFLEGSTINVNQPVGSLSISPSSRDVCLASRKGLYILDLANLNNAPRFVPQGGTWQIADCQWSPHPATSNLILSTSSQKLLVWDLSHASRHSPLSRSINAHARAITDINWHARDPNLLATASMDADVRGWDLRMGDRPFMRYCAWGVAGTQVKWNRQDEYLLATANGNKVLVWDSRKGSVPVTAIQAHDAKIYGIDWDRRHRHKLVTCSLDKTIKFWSIPELARSSASDDIVEHAPSEPSATISTAYPVWRARNLPFGHGVVSLPQRGDNALEMYGVPSAHERRVHPVERFEGHDDVVKEFVWRTRGGDSADFEDREFQLVTWSKDRTLRIWPIGRDLTEKVGYRFGEKIEVLVSRRGAKDITYTQVDAGEGAEEHPLMAQPSGIARQKPGRMGRGGDAGMTRGGGRHHRQVDQLEWLTKVRKNKASPDSSALPSRVGSQSRAGSRGISAERLGLGGGGDLISLKDEVVLVHKMFPRPKINFEKIDLHHRKLTMSVNGPWATNDRMAFLRIHWSFPSSYPYTPDLPTFELERNPTVSAITRHKIVTTIKEIRAANRQCLVQTSGFLLGNHEREGRRRLALAESQSESSEEGEAGVGKGMGPMMIRTCGGTFGPNGQLVCFFPKQTVLPRTRVFSRSPSVTRDLQNSPLARAMSALSRLDSSHQRKGIRIKQRFRRPDAPLPAVQAGSTLTLHDVAHLSPNPDIRLAKLYSAASIERNLQAALDVGRLDHAHAWALLQGLLSDPPPPAYEQISRQPASLVAESRDAEIRKERDMWEKGVARKRVMLDNLFYDLIRKRDIQLLALLSIALVRHVDSHSPPPLPSPITQTSPQQDYFALPRVHSTYSPANNTPQGFPTSSTILARTTTPTRALSRSSITALSPGTAASYRASGWSQMLNPSSISLRGAVTPKDRGNSFDIPAQPGAGRTLATSWEEASSMASGFVGGIPVPGKSPKGGPRERTTSRTMTMPPYSSGSDPAEGGAGSSGFKGLTPLKVAATGSDIDRSYSSSDQLRRSGSAVALTNTNSSSGVGSSSGISRVQFGSQSPLRRNFSSKTSSFYPGDERDAHLSRRSRAADGRAGGAGQHCKARCCSVKIELFLDGEAPHEPPSLMDGAWRARGEAWKAVYGDWLLRVDMLGKRAEVMSWEIAGSLDGVGEAAKGEARAFRAGPSGNGLD